MFFMASQYRSGPGRLNPGLFDEQGFNEKQLGERLVEMGCISPEQLDQA